MTWQPKLEQKVRAYLDGYTACHDFYHLERVKNWALKIANEINCDQDVLIAAALLHDLGYKGFENDAKNHNIHSMDIAKKWLPEVGFPEEKIDDVIEAIRLHDNFAWGHNAEKTNHIETKVLQDADRIEALGAIGIARLAYFFGEMGYPIYSDKPVQETKEVWTNHSLIDQLERDNLKKWEHLNFAISKKIAESRHKYLADFQKEIKREIEESK